MPEIQAETETGIGEFLAELFCYVKPEINPLIFIGRILFFLVIFIWGVKFIFTPLDSNYTMQSYWHLVNLPFQSKWTRSYTNDDSAVAFRPLRAGNPDPFEKWTTAWRLDRRLAVSGVVYLSNRFLFRLHLASSQCRRAHSICVFHDF